MSETEYKYHEPYDVILDYEATQLELSEGQKVVFNEAAEQIAAYQCHPETQKAIAAIALVELKELSPHKVVHLRAPRSMSESSVINQ